MGYDDLWSPGQSVQEGRVTSLDKSGAWLQIDGRPAFIPLAEIAWFEIEHPSAVVRVGDWVRVRVLGKTSGGILECSIRKLEGRTPGGPCVRVLAIVETPRGSHNIYRFDPGSGRITLYRVLHFTLHCPFEIGYLPDTRDAAGDPLRLVVLTSHPTFPGCQVECRIVGLLRTADSAGPDEKLLGIAERDGRMAEKYSLADVSHHTLNEIAHFFRTYRQIYNHSFKVKGWERADAAETILSEARQRFAKGAG